MKFRVAGTALLALLVGGVAFAPTSAKAAVGKQRGGVGGFDPRWGAPPAGPAVPYDGRFAFVRLTYQTLPGGYWYRGQPAWSHGYPTAEKNLMQILGSVTNIDAHQDTKTLSLEDPAIFEYPVLYIIEVSWWQLSEAEARNLRAFLDKGGFVVVDDFKTSEWRGGRGWAQFADNMRRVLPDAEFVDLDVSHPIFHAFFSIGSLEIFPQAYNAGRPIFRGLFEHNDSRRRLQMFVCYNTDISQFWEWSGLGFRPIDDTNEAYKLGVNAIVYGLTH